MICKHILLIMFSNEPKLILLHTVKWFQVLLCITKNSIKNQLWVKLLRLKIICIRLEYLIPLFTPLKDTRIFEN